MGFSTKLNIKSKRKFWYSYTQTLETSIYTYCSSLHIFLLKLHVLVNACSLSLSYASNLNTKSNFYQFFSVLKGSKKLARVTLIVTIHGPWRTITYSSHSNLIWLDQKPTQTPRVVYIDVSKYWGNGSSSMANQWKAEEISWPLSTALVPHPQTLNSNTYRK